MELRMGFVFVSRTRANPVELSVKRSHRAVHIMTMTKAKNKPVHKVHKR